MKKLKIAAIAVCTIIFFATSAYAQSSASSTAVVTAQLKKGLSISNLTGGLDFGEVIVTASAQAPVVTPGSGVNFEVIGHPMRNVTITFGNVVLDNNAWVGANGGTNSTITFTPNLEHTGNSSTYGAGTSVVSTNAYQLQNTTGDGYLYLWLGGSLAVAANQAHGDYTGTFSVTVEY